MKCQPSEPPCPLPLFNLQEARGAGGVPVVGTGEGIMSASYDFGDISSPVCHCLIISHLPNDYGVRARFALTFLIEYVLFLFRG